TFKCEYAATPIKIPSMIQQINSTMVHLLSKNEKITKELGEIQQNNREMKDAMVKENYELKQRINELSEALRKKNEEDQKANERISELTSENEAMK
ncbi:hypothetical protein PMAYCL1PPCAC_05901, partial [Pristionchus mayeri]